MSNNFTQKAEKALTRAVEIAENLGHTYVGTEHILLALAEDETSCASVIMRKRKIVYEQLLSAVKEYSGVGIKSILSSRDTTPKCRKLLENSYKCSKKYSAQRIGTEHILLALLEERESVSTKILTKVEADLLGLKDEVITFLRNSERGIMFAEPMTESSIPNLLKYGKSITRMAENGELDPVIGRDKETERVIRVLSRKNKNNPCLIGEAGVGKTAIIEGLATRIAEGRVPSCLLGKTIISLDLTSMVAGAKYRGDFEERIKNIMSEVSKNKSVILFIDEIHTIVGAGSAEGAIDAANILKPELSRGNIQLIGATTLSEYRKYIEKDSALERRFQPIIIEEPTVQKAIEILYGLKEKYENHHRIRIDDSAIYSAVTLSERYIQDRFLPDKALDLLDEACSMVNICLNMNNNKTLILREKLRQISIDKKTAINERDFEMALNLKELEKIYTADLSDELTLSDRQKSDIAVTSDDIKKVIFEITGIDLFEQHAETNEELNEKIKKYVIGQDKAINSLTDAVIRSQAGINKPDKPRGVFLFLGESGVGKTELARCLAKELFHSRDALIRYDMSEFSESYSVSKIIGSAPGYVGYDESNSVLERIRKHPYSIILFDEIEKAHPDVLALFLQIFDTGILTDSTGRKINFRNCFIIMTSNIGADRFRQSESVGFMKNVDEEMLEEKLKKYFKEEFINRIDEIIHFASLDESALKQIAKNKICEISNRLVDKGIQLEVNNSVYEYLIKIGKRKGLGARPLERTIVSKIENKIANLIVNNLLLSGDVIVVDVFNNEIIFNKTPFPLLCE